MEYLWQGIKIGLGLAILLGPIFFTLVQISVERGLKAGFAIGSGIWISDLIFINLVYFSTDYIASIVESNQFTLYVGITGAIILVTFGLSTLFNSSPTEINFEDDKLSKLNYLGYWLKGFLINTINPFTFFFWSGLMTTVLIKERLSKTEIILFFTGILGIVMLTDILKIVLAKRIRNRMKPIHLLWLTRISGIMLIGFGIFLLIKVILN